MAYCRSFYPRGGTDFCLRLWTCEANVNTKQTNYVTPSGLVGHAALVTEGGKGTAGDIEKWSGHDEITYHKADSRLDIPRIRKLVHVFSKFSTAKGKSILFPTALAFADAMGDTFGRKSKEHHFANCINIPQSVSNAVGHALYQVI